MKKCLNLVLGLALIFTFSSSVSAAEKKQSPQVQKLSAAPAATYPFEVEPNNSRRSANPILEDGIQGTISSATDEDWFSFVAPIDNRERLALLVPYGDYDYDLYLYELVGKQLEEIKSSTRAGNADEVIRFDAEEGKQYFILVKSDSGFTPEDPYTLYFDIR
ncbi:PPC domain-containing protein [Brevibacillus borstelensis]|uniref:PPC domain-containing protein n=1 Tax=Brevibacillus borstelensis TaxID=45462 RepID=UPI0030BFD186